MQQQALEARMNREVTRCLPTFTVNIIVILFIKDFLTHRILFALLNVIFSFYSTDHNIMRSSLFFVLIIIDFKT